MKRWIRFGAAASLALALFAVSMHLLTLYCQPMENAEVDLSLGVWGLGAEADYDQKGWTVFTQEGGAVTELTPDGYGGFDRLDEPGQTFYFSRVMEETVDSPTLCLQPEENTFAVFLDGEPLYTDCLDQVGGVGDLRLPTREWRPDELVVRLPEDYAGKTLTVAQSTPDSFAESNGRCWPAAVTLRSGYAKEGALISESFQTAIPATLAWAAEAVLLALFLRQAFQGRLNLGMLCGALAVFSYLSARILQTSFTFLYHNVDLSFRGVPIDPWGINRDLVLLLLLAMLSCKLSGWRQKILGTVTAGLGAFALGNFILAAALQNAGMLLFGWLARWSIPALLLALVFGFWEWNRRKWFFRIFCPVTLAGTALLMLPELFPARPGFSFFTIFPWLLRDVSLLAAFLSAIAEWLYDEVSHRTEERLLAQRGELARDSYEAMRRQNEQVMMLRHDMMKHFRLLRQTVTEEKAAAYLDELIGENEKIRPVVQSGNEMLDVILNGKLSAAADAGIAVEIVRMNAPDKLPLTDAELCSLMMNLLDNAVEGASAAGAERSYIKLDLCVKEHFFLFSCENSTTMEYIQKETAPGRGLGLKIVRQIVARYDDLMETEYGTDHYSVKLAIPLD